MSFKKYQIRLILPVLFYFVFVAFIAAQDKEKSPIVIFKSKTGYVYSDNSSGAHFTLEFIGDSIQTFDNGINAINVGRDLYQLIKHDYIAEQYTNRAKPSKEVELLLYFKKYEADYHALEIFKQELKITEEFFTNLDEKKFYLWYFPQPEYMESGNFTREQHELTTWHVYLSFITNQKVVVVYSPILENRMTIEEKISNLKTVAESANIFGDFIDESALYYKIDAANDDKLIEFVDPLGKYYVDIPEWLNMTQSSRDG